MHTTPKSSGRLIVAVVMLLLAAAGCRTADSGASALSRHEERSTEEIRRRVGEILAACEAKDFTHLEAFHLYGPKFSRFSASSPVRLDAETTRRLEHEGLSALNGLKMRTEDLKIDVFDGTGVATFLLDYSFTAGGRTLHLRDRTTLVFVRAGGEWKIAHEHLSPITTAGP